MTALDGFDSVAPYYDTLKTFVFGKSIYRSQIHFLKALPANGRFLIVGGGSGEILMPLLQANPGCRILYLEASSEMLVLAKKRVSKEKANNVTFIHGTEDNLITEVSFDGVITHFFLDVFSDQRAYNIARKLKEHLKKDGLWLVSDFANSEKWWQRCLLKTMYSFFKITCKIEADQLPAWQDQLRLTGLEQKSCAYFYGGFIKSCVYHNP